MDETEIWYQKMLLALYGEKYQEYSGISQSEIVNQLFGLHIPKEANSNDIVEVLKKHGHDVSFGYGWFNVVFTTELTKSVNHELSIQFDDDKHFFHVMSCFSYENQPFTYNLAETGQKIWAEIKEIEIPAYVQGEYESMKVYVENRISKEPTSKYTLDDYLDDMEGFE